MGAHRVDQSAVAGEAHQVLHVHTVVALTLGSAWRREMDERFDGQFGRSTLTFYEPGVIPKPGGAVPTCGDRGALVVAPPRCVRSVPGVGS